MKITFAKSDGEDISILTEKLNQHGLICGATGTGKTVTLKVLAEKFSELGIPVILSDVKGDLSNLAVGGSKENFENRLAELDIQNFETSGFPVELWDAYGQEGLPLRISAGELGPIFLSSILDLNETQAGVLNIAFRIADAQNLLLLDIKDLRYIIKFLGENREEISMEYGNVSVQSIAAIQRKLLLLEDLGGNDFIGEPSISIRDLIRESDDNRGMINIISSKKLINNPTIYSIFLLWLLGELYEELPEVGNPEFPKLVFFFDEAHLLFENSSKLLYEKILQTIRLIRSKGVGIFFVTQNPTDIPDRVVSQLGTKIVHQLRAFTPREQRNIKEISNGLRKNDNFDTETELQNLRTGEALISTLDESGAPTETKKGLIFPPKSSLTPLSEEELNSIIKSSKFYDKYQNAIDRESAYEILDKKFSEKLEMKKSEEREILEMKKKKAQKQEKSYVQRMFDSAVFSFSRQVGREVARGLMGNLKKKD